MTGLLLAMGALQHAMRSPIMHLRNLNPHVATATSDWRKSAKRAAHLPRQLSGECTSSAVSRNICARPLELTSEKLGD